MCLKINFCEFVWKDVKGKQNIFVWTVEDINWGKAGGGGVLEKAGNNMNVDIKGTNWASEIEEEKKIVKKFIRENKE